MNDATQHELERWKRKYERERKARLEAESIAERFTRDALHDPLTGLANRALFLDRLQHALAATGRHRAPLATVLLDLDGFKEINDSYGHSVGDELLVAVASRLTESVRSVDTVARLGGDEFALVIEDVDEKSKDQVIERVKRALETPFLVHGQPRQIGGSVGLALSRGNMDSPSDMLRRADMAMYAAKREGKSGHAVFETGMHTAMLFRLEMKSDLQRALAEREFVVHYQPVVELPGGALSAMEALVRWGRPGGGVIPPGEFIPLAEETGMIVPLGWWVLEESCRQFHEWQRGRAALAQLKLHVNLSARQLHDPQAPAKVLDALSASGLTADKVVLELTESSIMQDVEAALLAMQKLTALGVRMGIDDFGTGYSSLSYLQKLPMSVLKIDKSFVDHIAESKQGAALVRAIIGIGNALELKLVAEGVERMEQVGRLLALNCRYAQGYYFSRPLATEAMEKYLERAQTLAGS
ncbi:MAG: putative bifunctional diguanylate cyclase/phosphodiesterase [Gammaproteobacteria bacterium]